MLTLIIAASLTLSADFTKYVAPMRPELHAAGFGPQICSCSEEDLAAIREMGFSASRTHDWALINPNQRVCDYFHIFPLLHLDAKDPKNYVFGPTDYLLKRTREELKHEIFYRLGTSIEHSGKKIHFNTLIPEDFEKMAEIFAGTIRHYNAGWADGFKWNIRYWEIWNEPDGSNNMWCLPDGDSAPEGTDAAQAARDGQRRAAFVKFFVTCLKRLKSEFPGLKIGGPALCSMNRAYFTELLTACKAAGVAPDFISWHYYGNDPTHIIAKINEARQMCDELGFNTCELILNEWHYFGEYTWHDLRSPDPAVQRRVWEGPGGHNGIDSSCFNLSVLARLQTSPMTQAYYYGCRNAGAWGFRGEDRQKYKVFYGLKIFGDFLRRFTSICETRGTEDVTLFAGKSPSGEKALLVVDYRSGAKKLKIDLTGVAPRQRPHVWVHDSTHDFTRIPSVVDGGTLVLTKDDTNSAAFLIQFVQ